MVIHYADNEGKGAYCGESVPADGSGLLLIMPGTDGNSSGTVSAVSCLYCRDRLVAEGLIGEEEPPKTITVYTTDRAKDGERVSSAPSYDEHMSAIFPYFVRVSYDDAEVISQELSAGLHKMYLSGYPSFASTMDFRSNGKIIWFSSSGMTLLNSASRFDFDVDVPETGPTSRLPTGPSHSAWM